MLLCNLAKTFSQTEPSFDDYSILFNMLFIA
jgi:hypothetical protein